MEQLGHYQMLESLDLPNGNEKSAKSLLKMIFLDSKGNLFECVGHQNRTYSLGQVMGFMQYWPWNVKNSTKFGSKKPKGVRLHFKELKTCMSLTELQSLVIENISQLNFLEGEKEILHFKNQIAKKSTFLSLMNHVTTE